MEKVVFPYQSVQSGEMAAYMKNHFSFCGVPAPQRREFTKEVRKMSKKLPISELMKEISFYYNQKEREYHYLAIDLATENCLRFSLDELLNLKPLVIENAWWDSVDAWRKCFGKWSQAYMEEMPQVFNAFYGEESFWHRRVAINLQLMFKERTNTKLLQKAILYDRLTDEFFIQKAIGWSLRQYSKIDPQWVTHFLTTYELSSFAEKEAVKHIKNNRKASDKRLS